MSTSRKPVNDDSGETAATRALAREVAALRSTVDGLADQSNAAAEAASSALKATKTLADAFENLRPGNGGPGMPPPPPGSETEPGDTVGPPKGDDTPAPPWWTVTDPDAARARLTDLVEWIETVYIHYSDAAEGLRPCWLYHQDVVAELLALRDTYHAVYYGPAASPQAVQDWHDRYRVGTVRRVRDTLRMCSLHKHTSSTYTPPTTPGAAAVDDIATWWGTTHGETAPPAPAETVLREAMTARSVADTDQY